VHLALWAGLGYHPFARYADARLVHHVWKAGVPLAPWLTLNLLQFVLWTGLPVMAAFAADAALGLRRGGWRTLRGQLAPLVAAVILVTDLVGEAKSEVMRLWLFFVPLCCVAAGGRLAQWAGGDGGEAEPGAGPGGWGEDARRRWLVPATIALQLLYTAALKSSFDCH